MKKQEKIAFILKTLEELFPDPVPSLSFKDPFTCLVAVLLSAQSTDVRVNQITPLLFRLADTPNKMAKLSVSVIQEIIRPIGLSTKKAEAIHKLSKILVEQYASKVPETREDLEALPLVGSKTASVVLSQAFKQQAFAVDTHIIRLSKRWKLSNKKTAKQISEDLMTLFPKTSWSKVHLQMILYGRKYCPARAHKIAQCPICAKICENDSS